MQRRDIGWFHPLRRPIFAALAAGMLGIVGGCPGEDWPPDGWQGTRGRQHRRRCHHDDRRRVRVWVGRHRGHRGHRGIVWRGKRDHHDGHRGSRRQRAPSSRIRAVGGSLPTTHGQRVPQLAARPAARSRDDHRRAGARFVVDRRLRQRQGRDRVDLRSRRRAVSDRDRRGDRRGVRRRRATEQAAGLHPEERDRHGLLPVLRDEVWSTGLASAAHAGSGHALHHAHRERRRDSGRRQRRHARRYEGYAAFAQLSLPARTRGGPGGRRQWVLAVHEQRGGLAAVVLPDELDAGCDIAGRRRPGWAADKEAILAHAARLLGIGAVANPWATSQPSSFSCRSSRRARRIRSTPITHRRSRRR